MNTRALILAAGQGMRLRPITDDRPKCLVPLLGLPLIEHQIRTLEAENITNIHIVTGYRSEQVEALGYPTTKNQDFASTNMVASLFAALPFIEQAGDLIIGYGDIVYQRDNLRKLLDCDDDIAVMVDSNWRDYWALRFVEPLQDAETLILDPDGRITELGKKPSGYDRIQGQYTGLIKIRADRISVFVDFYRSLDRTRLYDGRDFANMFMTSLLQLLIDAGWTLRAATVAGGWLELDSVEDLRLYQSLAATGRLGRYYRAGDIA